MPDWRRNLYIIWAAQFILMAGFSMIMPFLPLYLGQLGVTDPKAQDLWAGLIYSANFMTAALFSPLWGSLADRHGRKIMMLRSGFGMAIVVALMGFTTNAWQLLGLRLLQGVITGFMPAAIAFMASNTPLEHTGYALGVLQTGGVAGNIVGPLIGGVLARVMGFQHIFFVTGFGCFLAATIVLVLVPERFTPVANTTRRSFAGDMREVLKERHLLLMFIIMFMTTFAINTVEPILTLFLATLQTPENLLTIMAGLIFSATGLANILAAPFLGRRGDRVGYRRVLVYALAGVALSYLPQALVQTSWQMLALRFLLGVFMGGLMPSANALIASFTPASLRGRAYGISTSFLFLGNVLGPLFGGAIAAAFHIRWIFPITSALLFINLFWVLLVVPEPEGKLPQSPQFAPRMDKTTAAAPPR
ncbi:MAG: MFS transporter [Firmicutes bacterium]|nr:MFS transporter [Bacillota bacterium]MCL5038632.1 MFS transporter [Bacillota bacterium]